jgi:hypothetical protein
VLKLVKATPGLREAFQREWIMGRRLNAVAETEPSMKILIHTGKG